MEAAVTAAAVTKRRTILSLCFRVMYCVNMVSVMVMVVSMVNLLLGQASRENEEIDFEDIGTVD